MEYKWILTWTGFAAPLGMFLVSVYGDRSIYGRPFFLIILFASLAITAVLFLISVLLAPATSLPIYVSLTSYFIAAGVVKGSLYASAAFIGRTSTERLQIFLVMVTMATLGSALSGLLVVSSQRWDFAYVMPIFGIGLFALVATVPSAFIHKIVIQTIGAEENSQGFLRETLRNREPLTLFAIIFLFSYSTSASAYISPQTLQEGPTLFAYIVISAVAIATFPTACLLVRWVATGHLTAQKTLATITSVILVFHMAGLFAAATQYDQLGILSDSIARTATLFLAAALLAKLSDIAHAQRARMKKVFFAKYAFAYFTMIALGTGAGSLTSMQVQSFDENKALLAASLAVAVWTIFLIVVLSTNKEPENPTPETAPQRPGA